VRTFDTGISSVTRPLTAEQAWRATRERADQCRLFFDFDGTLAPVLEDPTAVYPVPEVLTAIDALSQVVDRVAIVSARPVEFLQERFASVPHIDL